MPIAKTKSAGEVLDYLASCPDPMAICEMAITEFHSFDEWDDEAPSLLSCFTSTIDEVRDAIAQQPYDDAARMARL